MTYWLRKSQRMSGLRDWASDKQVTDSHRWIQGPVRHSTHLFQPEQPGQLKILQDLNKMWLLINRLNVEKPECEAGARTRSQWKSLRIRGHGQTRLRAWNDCDGSRMFSLFNALLFPAPCGYSSAGDSAAEWWHHIPQRLTSHSSSQGWRGRIWPWLSPDQS